MQKSPSVSVVIPSWNSESQLKKNFTSVFAASDLVGAEIIVVDDHSEEDDTLAYLESLGERIKLIKNKANLGFARTVNVGVAASKSDVVVLLNTDVRPEPDCFKHAITQFKQDDIFAITFNSDQSWAGGWWRDGLLQHSSIKAEGSTLNTQNPSLWASGGQAAFSRHKWVQLGGMDSLYAPFYWEDVDLGYRAWKRGWRILWDPDSRCVHDHQVSIIKHSFSPKYIKNIAQRNQLLFIWKNIHDATMIRSHFSALPKYVKNYPKAFFAALTCLPTAIRGRAVERRESIRSDQQVLANWK